MISMVCNVVAVWWRMLHQRRHYNDDGDKRRQITG
jgi:hypothetical protein